jgi:DNA invertase Pin-like site-specific DNA recombinase
MSTKTKPSKIVAYRRTSTNDQRLGIDAQDVTLKRIAAERACPVVRTFTEHESGGNNERPELDKAIRHARRIGAMVVVAKLDRLARDSQFLLKLYNGDVPLIFGDLPEVDGSAASRLIVQMMANIAEFERRRIGERTKEALAELKAKGVKLGTPRNLKQEHRVKGARVSAQRRREKAAEQMSDVLELIAPMRKQGRRLAHLARILNDQEYLTARGSTWTATQVKRVLDRADATPVKR